MTAIEMNVREAELLVKVLGLTRKKALGPVEFRVTDIDPLRRRIRDAFPILKGTS